MQDTVNLGDRLAHVADHWAPRTVTRHNDHGVPAVKVRGQFVVHAHEEIGAFVLVLRRGASDDRHGGHAPAADRANRDAEHRGRRHRDRAPDDGAARSTAGGQRAAPGAGGGSAEPGERRARASAYRLDPG